LHEITLNTENTAKKIEVGKIVCVGRNYAKHAKELGNEVPEFPIIFLKPPSAMIYSGGTIEYPHFSNNVHHEVELVLLIGDNLKNASEEQTASAIIGYGVGLDMTARDLQDELRKQGSPWTVSKCFDTSAVVSEFVTAASVPNILHQEIELRVNGETRQHAKLDEMIFKPAELVSKISSMLMLEAGDLVFTGTPQGVSAVGRGDVLHATLGSACSLDARVV
jgi:5-carboxymethyl-2-hydroxymuconate isomerase